MRAYEKKVVLLVALMHQCLLPHTLMFVAPKENGALSKPFMSYIKERFNIECFVETGTWRACTTLPASQIFDEIHTIELSPSFFSDNVRLFKDVPSIKAYLGDSKRVLDQILPVKQPCAFYLDAHYSAGDTARAETNTPLEQEVNIIGKHMSGSVIIVDDLRFCQQQHIIDEELPRYPESLVVADYPSLTTLRDIFHAIDTSYQFVLWGDMGFAFSKTVYPDVTISPVLEAMTRSRFFEETRQHTQQETLDVIQAEVALLHPQPQEVFAVMQLLHPDHGLFWPELSTPHYRLWNGLLCLGLGEFERAQQLLERAVELGLSHWRVQWYLAHVYTLRGDHAQADACAHKVDTALHEIGLSKTDLPDHAMVAKTNAIATPEIKQLIQSMHI